MNWLQRIAARILPQQHDLGAELAQAQQDLAKAHSALAQAEAEIDAKNHQIRASAAALAKANAESVRQHRLADQMHRALENERRIVKQLNLDLSSARKQQKRR